MRLAAVGEAMIELSMSGDTAQVGVAGDTLNTAIYLKRSAPEVEVDYITRLGTDPFSDRIADFIASERIGIDRIERDANASPGLYAITIDVHGERSFTYWRDTSAARSMFTTDRGPDFSVLDSYDMIYLSGISLAILPGSVRGALLRWLGDFRRAGGQVVYDNNYRPRLWMNVATARNVNEAMWQLADIALPSLDDEVEITGEATEALARRFLAMKRTGALKRGAAGPICLQTGQSGGFPTAEKVVDTTAAGDSFNGGYLGAILSGMFQADALRAGHDLAMRVVGHKGAILPRDEAMDNA